MDVRFAHCISQDLSSFWAHLATRGCPSLKLQDFSPGSTLGQPDFSPTLNGAKLQAVIPHPFPTVYQAIPALPVWARHLSPEMEPQRTKRDGGDGRTGEHSGGGKEVVETGTAHGSHWSLRR